MCPGPLSAREKVREGCPFRRRGRFFIRSNQTNKSTTFRTSICCRTNPTVTFCRSCCRRKRLKDTSSTWDTEFQELKPECQETPSCTQCVGNSADHTGMSMLIRIPFVHLREGDNTIGGFLRELGKKKTRRQPEAALSRGLLLPLPVASGHPSQSLVHKTNDHP